MSRKFQSTVCASLIAIGAFAFGCGGSGNNNNGGGTDNPYDTCSTDNDCPSDLNCLPSTLPSSSGFTGESCSATCNVDSDCPQDSNFDAACINGQCYLSCPQSDVGVGNYCPYSQDCVAFQDQSGNEIDLCTP